MEIPLWLARALAWLGVLLIVFALVDFGLGRFMDIDITGVPWSPLVSGVIGSLLLRFFKEAVDDD